MYVPFMAHNVLPLTLGEAGHFLNQLFSYLRWEHNKRDHLVSNTNNITIISNLAFQRCVMICTQFLAHYESSHGYIM